MEPRSRRDPAADHAWSREQDSAKAEATLATIHLKAADPLANQSMALFEKFALD
jgi:hypothetical protein